MFKKQRGEGISILKKEQSQTTCEQNPNCCSKRNVLSFAKLYKPPLIGPQKDFCNQAIGRGIPVPNCALGKPVSFIYPRSIFYGLEPADKPGSSPQLKNWKKWCTVWYSNQTALREKGVPPSIMTCGEGWRRKMEDLELVERTIHAHHTQGFNIPNILHPSPIAPGKECLDIQETLPRRLYRDYPPMEKIRLAKEIRKELHLPQRHPAPVTKDERVNQYWKWDRNWSNSKYLQETKVELREDIAKQAPIQPCPDKLIVKGKSMPGVSKLKSKKRIDEEELGLPYPIPELIFSTEEDGPLYQLPIHEDQHHVHAPLKTTAFEEKRGPVLYIEGSTFQVLLKKQVQINPESPMRENQFLYDIMDGFAATTRCKEIRHVGLKNQGTTAIRFQWLRSSPSTGIRNLLGNPAKMLHLNERKANELCSGSTLLRGFGLNRPGSDSNQKNKVAVHLSVSRKVDPALTRTLKIMRNCATSELAFENLLLMLAFRVPRLRRLLIRRTGRQLRRRRLPLHVQQLYLKIKEKQKVERKLKEEARQKSEKIVRKSIVGFEEPTLGESNNFLPVDELEVGEYISEAPELCPCQLQSNSSGESLGFPTNAAELSTLSQKAIKPKKIHKLKICECSDPKPKPNPRCKAFRIHDSLEPKYELDGEDYMSVTAPLSTSECLEYEPSCPDDVKSFSEEVFDCLGEWEEIFGEDRGQEENTIPEGATPDFYPLGYGDCLVKHKKICRGTLIPKTQIIAQPKETIDTWLDKKRISKVEEPESISPRPSDKALEKNDPIFYELTGYAVTRDFDERNQLATIEVRRPNQEILPQADAETGGESGENRRVSGIPVHPTQNTHKLNVQSLSVTQLDRKLNEKPEQVVGEFVGESDLEEADLNNTFNKKNSLSGLNTSLHSLGLQENSRKISPKPAEKVAEFLKDPSFDFHFRELPGVLLPGQSIKFPIIFRPREPGFYYETLYLVTHPRLSEATYTVRLNGICMDPELPILERPSTPPSKHNAKRHKQTRGTWKTKQEKVESDLQEEMLKRQGRDLFEAIIDNVFYLDETIVNTLPFGKVTTESIFYAHNPELVYHHGVAEKALQTVRNLVSHVVPKQTLIEHRVCPLNIESLYKELIRSDSEYMWNNFKSEETEKLLSNLAEYTQKLIKPNAMNSVGLTDQKYNASYFRLLGIIDEVSLHLVDIEKLYDSPELVEVNRASIYDRIQRAEAKLAKKNQAKNKSAVNQPKEINKPTIESTETEEKEQQVETSQHLNKVDVGTQKYLNEPEQEPEISEVVPREISVSKGKDKDGTIPKSGKKKGKKKRKEEKSKSKEEVEPLQAVRSPSPQADTEGDETDQNQNEDPDYLGKIDSQLGNRGSRGSQTDERPISAELDKKVKEEFDRLQQLRKYQAKRVVFENILGGGIEKLLSVLDNMNNLYPYKKSEYIVPAPDSKFYCC